MTVDWREDAACRGEDIDLFFPPPGDSVAVLEAKKICARCPVTADCAEAGNGENHGVWGGTSASERRRARRATPTGGTR